LIHLRVDVVIEAAADPVGSGVDQALVTEARALWSTRCCGDTGMQLPSLNLHQRSRLADSTSWARNGAAPAPNKGTTYFSMGGFFVEAGAFDGEARSNSLFFERERGWTGLLFEANPQLFQQKKKLNMYFVPGCMATSNAVLPLLTQFTLAGGLGGISSELGSQ
jgi:hypothetical protein